MRSFLLASLAGLLLLPSAALADVREGRVTDPRDGTLHENVDGSSYRDPDIELVAARYDTAGAISLHLRLYEPFESRSTLPTFHVCALNVRDDEPTSCSSFGEKGDLSFSGSHRFMSSQPYFELQGYEGTIPAAISFSEDGRSLFVDGSHPALAGRGYNSVRGVDYRGDAAEGFPLYGPGGWPACSDRVDNDGDGTTDTREDWGCDDALDDDERLTSTPPMTRADAHSLLKRALTERFGNSFRYRSGWRRGCTRTTETRFSCRVAWGIGDVSFRGTIRLWHGRDGEDPTWSYSGRIVRTNEYCRIVTPRRRCTKVIQVR